jgi:hypothetical protein
MQNNLGKIKRNPEKLPGEPGKDAPDYIGDGIIDNEPMRIEGWIVKKEGQETYMSLRFFDAQDGLAKAMLVRTEGLG